MVGNYFEDIFSANEFPADYQVVTRNISPMVNDEINADLI